MKTSLKMCKKSANVFKIEKFQFVFNGHFKEMMFMQDIDYFTFECMSIEELGLLSVREMPKFCCHYFICSVLILSGNKSYCIISKSKNIIFTKYISYYFYSITTFFWRINNRDSNINLHFKIEFLIHLVVSNIFIWFFLSR